MLVGGKKLRPLLMQQTYVMFGGHKRVIEPFMAAMEMIHTHSLIHDDFRRWTTTNTAEAKRRPTSSTERRWRSLQATRF